MRPIPKNLLALLAGIILALPFTGLGTPPSDPICAAPNSLLRVEGLRLEMARRVSAKRSALRPMGLTSVPQLSFDGWDSTGGLGWLLSGPAGDAFQLESNSDLGPSGWTPAATVVFGGRPVSWRDGPAGTQPQGFYRLAAADPEALTEPVNNFRLLDHEGRAHDLFYATHRSAVVVVEAGEDLQQLAPSVAMLQQFALVHTNQIEIWILLSDPNAVRTNVVAQAKAMGLNLPVLDDRHGLAARTVGLTRALEVAVIQSPNFTVSYRGALSDDSGSPQEQSYLGRALAEVTGGASLTFYRTAVRGPQLSYTFEPTPDYARDIAPILHQYCAVCHRPNGVAPFALTNYSVVREQASSIQHALLSGSMPPWHADPEHGRFANDRSLPGELKSALVRWIHAGAPRGEGSDPLAELPPPPAFDEWPAELGEPDALVTIPLQQIKATGSEPYRYVFAQTPNPTNVWLRAAVIRPSNYRATHHILVWPGRIGNGSANPDVSTYQSHIAEFVPGYQPLQLPADSGILLGRSNWLTFNLHYTTQGMATNDQPVLALWFHKTKPPKTWGVAGIANTSFSVPPYAGEHPVRAEWITPGKITVHRLNPHMHVRGKRMKYEAIYPGGAREILLSVPDYDFNWQIGYVLAEPKVLPAGSRIVVTGAFDNSPQNLSNPDPSKTVRWGDQSWMEMFIGYVDYTQ